ncbi:MAG: Fe-S cluster assembly protein SufB [archaeon]|nr:Fe-S cluster assembly protein SufB [archaeon]
MTATNNTVQEVDYTKYDFRDSSTSYDIKFNKGLSEDVVREISRIKKEPEWMLNFRLRALKVFNSKPMPKWGGDMSGIEFDQITYYMSPTGESQEDWDKVPDYIKNTFDRLGIPEAEKKFLGGVGAQYESEMVYHSIREDLEKLGVVFLSMDDGLRQYPELVKEHFSKIIPIEDNKFAALNSAVWSGGSFVYIPKNTKVDTPLQAYFRINAERMGQFERTLIIADENSTVHYIEGCFTKGTEINTEQGIKSIEEIKIGDKVLTHKGRTKEVYHIQERPYKGKLYKINYFGDTTQTIEATEEHPILAVKREKLEYKNNNWNPEWINANKLEKSDYLALPIDRNIEEKNERTFLIKLRNKEQELKLKTDADFFRLAGYYLAEGSILNEHYLTFTFNEKEKSFIEDVKTLLGKFFNGTIIEQKPYKHGISIVLSSTIAARFFMQEFGKGAQNKCIPKWVELETPSKQKELIKAHWRGDGSYMYSQYAWGIKRMFRINTISKELATQMRNLLLRQNIFASINKQNRKMPRKTMYTVYIGGQFLQAFGVLVEAIPVNESLHSNNTMLQKISQKIVSYAHITQEYAFTPIKSVNSEEVETMVYNFSVEEDESYIASGVAVHNCTAPKYSSNSLHSAIVEIVAKEGANVRYTTIQNWSNNIYNLVTKRAYAYKNATVSWVDGNLGSKLTMKYPSIYLMGEGAKGEVLSIAMASKGQHQDAGAKAVHMAPNTTSTITSKSISLNGGRTTYRGLLKVAKGAYNVKSNVRCDALLMDDISRSDTYPSIEIDEQDAVIAHEATVGKVGKEQIFYLMSRGLSEDEALTMIIMGFIRPFTRELPMEYAVELNRLIEMEMEGSVG